MGRRLMQAAVVVAVLLAAAQLIRPTATTRRLTLAARLRHTPARQVSSLSSWIARAATATPTTPCGRGTRKSRQFPGGFRITSAKDASR